MKSPKSASKTFWLVIFRPDEGLFKLGLILGGGMKLLVKIVDRIAPFNFRRALNFFRQTTVHVRWDDPAIRSLWLIHESFKAISAVIRLSGFVVNIWRIKFLASGVTVSHSGERNEYVPVWKFENPDYHGINWWQESRNQ